MNTRQILQDQFALLERTYADQKDKVEILEKQLNEAKHDFILCKQAREQLKKILGPNANEDSYKSEHE